MKIKQLLFAFYFYEHPMKMPPQIIILKASIVSIDVEMFQSFCFRYF